jgi:hypothetical protein
MSAVAAGASTIIASLAWISVFSLGSTAAAVASASVDAIVVSSGSWGDSGTAGPSGVSSRGGTGASVVCGSAAAAGKEGKGRSSEIYSALLPKV